MGAANPGSNATRAGRSPCGATAADGRPVGLANAEHRGVTAARRLSERSGCLLPEPWARDARLMNIEAGSQTCVETWPYLPDPAVERSEAASSMG